MADGLVIYAKAKAGQSEGQSHTLKAKARQFQGQGLTSRVAGNTL